jgi:tetratricopeptide (TPR) repeat protein
MHSKRILLAILVWGFASTLALSVRGQNSVSATSRPSVTVLDSTKEQDGLLGSVRRVKTEAAKIEFKDGRSREGPPQLVEITTYGVKGNRVENISYPVEGSLSGKEEYKYDERGNIIEMTLRDDRGAILSREAYSYEFDKFGNWTKMVTSLVVFENGVLQREPVEVTHRTLTYYFDDNIAKIVEAPNSSNAIAIPEPATFAAPDLEILRADASPSWNGHVSVNSLGLAGEPPPLLTKRSEPESAVGVSSLETNQSEVSVKHNGGDVLQASPGLASSDVPARLPTEIAPAKSAAPEVVAKVSSPLSTSPGKFISETESISRNSATNLSNQKNANDYYKSGRERFDAGDIRAAVDAYLQSIKLEPGSAEVYLNLGHAYLKLEKDRDAVKAFKESLKLNPTAPEAAYGLGFASFRMGRFRDAAEAFKKATTLDPQMAKAHYGLSLAYQEIGDSKGLVDEYRILEKLDRSLARKLEQSFPQYDLSCRYSRGCQ